MAVRKVFQRKEINWNGLEKTPREYLGLRFLVKKQRPNEMRPQEAMVGTPAADTKLWKAKELGRMEQRRIAATIPRKVMELAGCLVLGSRRPIQPEKGKTPSLAIA